MLAVAYWVKVKFQYTALSFKMFAHNILSKPANLI